MAEELLLSVSPGAGVASYSAPECYCSAQRALQAWRHAGLERAGEARPHSLLSPQAVLCSCFIPFYCGLIPPAFRGVVSVPGCQRGL